MVALPINGALQPREVRLYAVAVVKTAGVDILLAEPRRQAEALLRLKTLGIRTRCVSDGEPLRNVNPNLMSPGGAGFISQEASGGRSGNRRSFALGWPNV
jgi:hypothetical protein